MNRTTASLLWMIVSAMCWCHLAEAGTIYGPSGLILNPTAYVPPARSASLGATTFVVTHAGIDNRWISSSVDLGVGGQGEVGITYLHKSGSPTTEGLGGFGKYQLQKEVADRPAVAVGVNLIGGWLKTTEAYLTATKRLSSGEDLHPVTLTLGVIRSQDRDGIPRHDTGLYGGFDVKVAPRFDLVTEWRSRTNGNPKDSSGAMLMYGRGNYGVAAGFVNNGTSDRHQFIIGVGFNVSTLD